VIGGQFDWDSILKIGISFVTVTGGLFALPKILYENSTLRKSQRREEYEFSKKFISEVFEDQICKKPKVHPFIVEKGYQAISGEMLGYNEIMTLLNFPNPLLALKKFFRSQELLILTKDGLFEYIKKYNSTGKRWFYRKLYSTAYFVLAMVAILPFTFKKQLGIELESTESIIKYSLFVVAILFWAISQLLKYINMEFAEYIIEEQAKIENSPLATEPTAQPLPVQTQEKSSHKIRNNGPLSP
jgi:hypothetical protein